MKINKFFPQAYTSSFSSTIFESTSEYEDKKFSCLTLFKEDIFSFSLSIYHSHSLGRLIYNERQHWWLDMLSMTGINCIKLSVWINRNNLFDYKYLVKDPINRQISTKWLDVKSMKKLFRVKLSPYRVFFL